MAGMRATAVSTPRETQTLHDLVAARAAEDGSAPAVAFRDARLTYGELAERAGRLAGRLCEAGVRRGSLVALYTERSVDLVPGILGILGAGGAYVPIDPAYPSRRVEFMLEDAEPDAIVTQSRLAPALAGHGRTVVCVDADDEDAPPAPVAECGPDDVAYVMYTSGSTGAPKGVACRHAGVLNLLADFDRRRPLGPGDACSQWTSYGFDVSVYEIFSALVAGASLRFVPDELRIESRPLFEWLAAHGITACYLPPFVLSDFDDWLGEGHTLPLRRLLVGVEPLQEDLLASIGSKLPGVVILNGYGPTETTILSTLYDVDPRRPLRRRAPIGRAVAGTDLRIVDEDGLPAPAGEVGELLIGGAGLAFGYHRRPGLTAERFLPDAAGAPGTRVYRTGDLVRALPSGDLMFLGRIDRQVKVRGFRVEPGEVEAILARHGRVRDCLVVLAGTRLVAYVVARDGEAPSATELRELAATHLPEHMVPSAFVFLPALPLGPNGKVDHAALPPPPPTRPQLDVPYVAPRSATERIVAETWSELLAIAPVGVHDDFLALGGTSLHSAQSAARLREALGVDVSAAAPLEARTPAALAALLDRRSDGGRAARIALVRAEDRGEAPVSHAQLGLWFLDQLARGNPMHNVPMSVRLRGALDHDALARALNEIVRRHDALRSRFELRGREPVQVVREEMPLALPVADLRHLDPPRRQAEAQRRLDALSEQSFDLERDPLLRAELVRTGDDEHVLDVCVHHIVFDAWSARLFVRELDLLYRAFVADAPSPLPELPLQYGDFARWQRRWLESGPGKRQLGYWRTRLADAPRTLELPTDRPRPPVRRHRGSLRRFELEPELTATLRAFSSSHGVTPFTTLLATFHALLGQWAGTDDVCVAIPVANRSDPLLESLVGFFVNTLVVRASLGGSLSFAELLRHVQTATLEAFANQDAPFPLVVRELSVPRDASRAPLAQVMLSLDDTSSRFRDPPGVELDTPPLDQGTARFDLILGLRERPDRFDGYAEYDSDLWDATTMERLVDDWRALLVAATATPDAPVASLHAARRSVDGAPRR